MSRRKQREMIPVSREMLEVTASIIGKQGAAFQALLRADEIGPAAQIFVSGDTFVVVDPSAPEPKP